MTVLLVTGSRHGHPHVTRVLDRYVKRYGRLDKLFVGDADGADMAACIWGWMKWARGEGPEPVVVVADWTKFGKAAGPRRNTAMAFEASAYSSKHGVPRRCVAFPVGGSRGTRNCIKAAKLFDFLVYEVDATGTPSLV